MSPPPDPPHPSAGPLNGVDWLEIGPEPESARSGTRRRRLLIAAACLSLVTISGVAVTAQNRTTPQAEEPAPASTPSSESPNTPRPGLERRPSFTDTSLAIPGEKSVLFARTERSIFRIDLNSGRVTRTGGLRVVGGGPVSLIVGPRQVIVGPTEGGTGWLIPDGRRPRPLPEAFRTAQEVLPGPPGLLWARSVVGQARGKVALVDYSGKLQKRAYLLRSGRAQSDGAGGLLLNDVGGVYQADQTDIRRLTTGGVTGVGPNHFLLVNCNSQRRCSSFLHDRVRGTERRLGAADTTNLPSGTVSPDGRHAALTQGRDSRPPVVRVVDLTDGSARTLPGQPDLMHSGSTPNLLWTPDGRRLIALLDGQVVVHDTKTGLSRRSEAALPKLLQLALRPVS